MEFIRIDSIQGHRLHCVFEITVEEYNRIIRERNERVENERQAEIDCERERQWYGDMGDRLSE